MEKGTTPLLSVFSSLLKKVKDKELREFMEAYALENNHFQTEFLLRFSDRLKVAGKEKFLLLIRQVIEQLQHAAKVTDATIIRTMADQLHSLLKKAEDQLAIKNYLDPFHLAVALIEEVHPILTRLDDPDALLKGCIIRSFSILDNIVTTDAGPDLKELIFEAAMQEAVRADYRLTGLEEKWFDILMDAAVSDHRQLQLLDLLNQLIHETGSHHKGGNSERYEEYFLRKKITLLDNMGRAEEAKKVVEENLRIRAFRRQMIDESMAKEDFGTAKELIKASKLSDQQKGRLYISSEWDELLLKIAVAEDDIRSIRQAGLRLFYDRFNIKFYQQVKSTYDAEKWMKEVEKIIATLKAETHYGLKGIRLLAALFIEEKYWTRLLQLMQKNASLEFVEDYYELLKEKFPAELVEIYREALRRYAEHNMGSEHYNYVVKTIRKIQSLHTGNEVAKALTTEFKVKYSQRRNMVKALNKLVF